MSIITVQPSTGRIYVDGVPITLMAYGFGPRNQTGNLADLAASARMSPVPLHTCSLYFRAVYAEAWQRFQNEGFRP